MEKRIGDAVSIIKSAEEVLEIEAPIAVAYLDSVEGDDAELFVAAARQDGVEFHMTDDAQIAKKFGLDQKTPALVLLKKQNEKVATFGTCLHSHFTTGTILILYWPCAALSNGRSVRRCMMLNLSWSILRWVV